MFETIIARELIGYSTTGNPFCDALIRAIIPTLIMTLFLYLKSNGKALWDDLKERFSHRKKPKRALSIISQFLECGTANSFFDHLTYYISLEQNQEAFVHSRRINVSTKLYHSMEPPQFLPVKNEPLYFSIEGISFSVYRIGSYKVSDDTTELAMKVVKAIIKMVVAHKKSSTRTIKLWDTEPRNQRWTNATMDTTRSFNTIRLQNDMHIKLQEDVNRFISTEQSYAELGICWHRGYLFYGPPGTGKSSLVLAIANMIKWPIYAICLSGYETTEMLLKMFREIPRCAIVLFEEIDTIPQTKIRLEEKVAVPASTIQSEVVEKPKFNTHGQLLSAWTLGTLLNLLDGIYATPARIVMMTTNHIEKLDPALIRAGRIDVHLYMGYCDLPQIKAIYQAFFPNEDNDKKEEIVLHTESISPAMISGICTKYHDEPILALKYIKDLCK